MPREYFTITSDDNIDETNYNLSFKVKLPKLYQNVRSLKLKQACILNDLPNVPISISSKTPMRIYFSFQPIGGSTYIPSDLSFYQPFPGWIAYNDLFITIPRGQYNATTLAATINSLLMNKDSFFNTYQPFFRLRCKYESSIDRIAFYGSQNFYVSFTSASPSDRQPGSIQALCMNLLGYDQVTQFRDNLVNTDGSGVAYNSSDSFRGTTAMGTGSELIKGISGVEAPDMNVEQQLYMKIDEVPLIRARRDIDNYFFPFLINKDAPSFETVVIDNTGDLIKYFPSRTDLDVFTITFFYMSGDVAPIGAGSIILTFEIVYGDDEPDGDVQYETFKRWAKDLIPSYPNISQSS